ncbi:MAG: exodeoxyribonuclease III [Alphaproteobacteria bacterium]|nr:exodeoxyribonuclease III [Alphaproteobacteria bacterium]
MKIATWNVNSIRVRLPLVMDWLSNHAIDVLLLQELKCQQEQFPEAAFFDLGYNCAVLGQKTYNGVAILSKYPIEDVQYNIPEFEDTQARYIEAFTAGKRVASVYVPNGSEVGSDKYDYKLDFLKALARHMQAILAHKEEIVIGGDFNIAPSDLDVYDPEKWDEQILCSKAERHHFRTLLNMGYYDAFRTLKPQEPGFTWWDYRAGSFAQNKGMRIDHFLLSPETVDIATDVTVDTYPRTQDQPSDHAPVILDIL